MELNLDVTKVPKQKVMEEEKVEIVVGQDTNLPAVFEPESVKKRIVDTLAIEEAHKQTAREQALQFDYHDSNQIASFAVSTQQAYLDTIKQLLKDAKVKDAKEAAAIILLISRGIEMVNLEGMKNQISGSKEVMSAGAKFMSLFKKSVNYIEAFAAKQQDIVNLIGEAEEKIEDAVFKLEQNVVKLDQMFEKVEGNFYRLGVYIYAGELVMDRAKEEYDALRLKAIDTKDGRLIAQADTLLQKLILFDTRLLKLKTAYVRAPITMKKIRIVQDAARGEVQNLINLKTTNLPAFVENIIMLLSLYDLAEVQVIRKEAEDQFAQMQDLEMEMLGETALAAKEGLAKGVFEVQQLEKSVNTLKQIIGNMAEADKQILTGNDEAETSLVEVNKSFNDSIIDASVALNN